uniref:CBS domain-containing protein n=1 Tax=Timspurckia oligopyrenoides TaxID=708627 RepID=A0A7S1EQM0_9RHOD|mmetsp:Transcript_12481/g.22541  ORF Transcript_12481/g.22541 Transcript_12481/m.22541 type:complete len:352 (+) Transcript_12481:81-1136(+)
MQENFEAWQKQLCLFWSNVQCGSLIDSNRAITLPATISVPDACQVLATNNILSALVESHAPPTVKYCGLFSLHSLLEYVVSNISEISESKTLAWSAFQRLCLKFKDVGEFCSSRTPSYVRVDSDENVITMLRFFANGTHRCSVLDKHTSMVLGTLSQSRVLNYVYEHRSEEPFESILKHEISELPSNDHIARGGSVLSIFEDAILLDAVKVMLKHDVSSVAVLDEDGLLCGSLSLSDFKYLFRIRRIDLFWCPIHEFIRFIRGFQSLSERHAKDSFPYFATRSNKTIGSVIERMVATKVHHLWIIDDARHAVGVVSITDILRVLAPLEDAFRISTQASPRPSRLDRADGSD